MPDGPRQAGARTQERLEERWHFEVFFVVGDVVGVRGVMLLRRKGRRIKEGETKAYVARMIRIYPC